MQQQRVHAVELGAVNQVASLWLHAHQIGLREFFEVEGQGAGRDGQLSRQDAGRQAVRPGHHQRAKGAQALHLGQCREGSHGLLFLRGEVVHSSILFE